MDVSIAMDSSSLSSCFQNTGLSTENLRLKKNISALLKTARQEVLRKDEEIKRLNQRYVPERSETEKQTS